MLENKAIYFGTKEAYLLKCHEIAQSCIVFIEETKEIIMQGGYIVTNIDALKKEGNTYKIQPYEGVKDGSEVTIEFDDSAQTLHLKASKILVNDTNLEDALNSKVSAEKGKGLSTNDFDNEDKAKVDNVPANTNAELAAAKIAVFNDLWKTAGGEYNMDNDAVTYPYMANGVKLTYEEARETYDNIIELPNANPIHDNAIIKTTLARGCADLAAGGPCYIAGLIRSCPKLEVLNLMPRNTINNKIKTKNKAYIVYDAAALREIIGVIHFSTTDGNIIFGAVPQLTTVQLANVTHNIAFKSCPKINLESWTYLVENAANTEAITVTVHADVYAKLTSDTTNEAAAALTEEELAQWVALNEAAAEQLITFAVAE